MFSSISEQERHAFTTQNYDGFIPGYTGHCPTLKFQYGRTYGFRTKEILKEIRSKRFYQDAETKQNYHSILKPIMQNKEKFLDFTQNYRNKPPPCISGYTGFIPTLNFRYGKPYSRAVDDSICEIREKERSEVERLTTTTKSVPPRLKQPVRSEDEVQAILNNYLDKSKYKKSHKISPEHPPITGYTGHIPRVIGNEESLSHSYHITVINGLKRLQQEKEKFENLKKSHNKVLNVLEEYKNLHK